MNNFTCFNSTTHQLVVKYLSFQTNNEDPGMSKMIDQLEDARVIVKQRQQKPSLKQFCKRMLT